MDAIALIFSLKRFSPVESMASPSMAPVHPFLAGRASMILYAFWRMFADFGQLYGAVVAYSPMMGRVSWTVEVLPARQRLILRMPPLAFFSASPMASPKETLASLVKLVTLVLFPQDTPRITSST